MDQYFKANQDLWDRKTHYHKLSAFYDMDRFMEGKCSLQEIELEALEGRVAGKQLLHLQCHFGQDSLSWARKGARVTGVDFSAASIKLARQLNKQLKLDARFVQSNVLDLKGKMDEQFDIVFTSYGTILWLPDLRKWASVIHHYLKEGGIFYIVDFHPAFYVFDHPAQTLRYDYFNTGEAFVEEVKGTYADPDAPIEGREYFWSHSLEEVIMSLLEKGLKLRSFREFPFSPYRCFESMQEVSPGRFVYQGVDCSFPHLFSLEMEK